MQRLANIFCRQTGTEEFFVNKITFLISFVHILIRTLMGIGPWDTIPQSLLKRIMIEVSLSFVFL